ncbi:unnamed protein product [Closterium sp. NIES-54]
MLRSAKRREGGASSAPGIFRAPHPASLAQWFDLMPRSAKRQAVGARGMFLDDGYGSVQQSVLQNSPDGSRRDAEYLNDRRSDRILTYQMASPKFLVASLLVLLAVLLTIFDFTSAHGARASFSRVSSPATVTRRVLHSSKTCSDKYDSKLHRCEEKETQCIDRARDWRHEQKCNEKRGECEGDANDAFNECQEECVEKCDEQLNECYDDNHHDSRKCDRKDQRCRDKCN